LKKQQPCFKEKKHVFFVFFLHVAPYTKKKQFGIGLVSFGIDTNRYYVFFFLPKVVVGVKLLVIKMMITNSTDRAKQLHCFGRSDQTAVDGHHFGPTIGGPKRQKVHFFLQKCTFRHIFTADSEVMEWSELIRLNGPSKTITLFRPVRWT
jgi:hypothetical protein